MHSWLEEMAWTEADVARCLARRNRHLADSEALAHEPMFCLETVRAIGVRVAGWHAAFVDGAEVLLALP